MLPATFVTFATFLLELCTTSPVYNMQPAFITANIGTAGRNIRNLPCISRKNNQSGVCMFAIDCLKANGTHLGTCIDRFYFGSCCHIEPVHDIIDNSIDTDIIPAREPPQRLSSTIRPSSTTSLKAESTKITTVTSTATTEKPTTTTTRKPTTTATATTTKPTTTEKPKPKPIQEETTTVGYKLTTFQSVDVETTTRIVTTTKPKTTSPKTTPKPKPTKTTTKATPKPTKNTPKPVRTTTTTRKPSTKPSTNTTRRPVPTTTRKPSVATKTTRKPTTTTRKPTTTSSRRPSTTTAKRSSTKPSTTATKKPVTTPKPSKITKTTTARPVSTTATKATTVTKKPSTTSTSAPTSKPTTAQAVVNRNTTEGIATVGSNLATNEIEIVSSSTVKLPSTTQGSIVTWTVIESDKNVSAPTTASPGNSTSEEWTPITTADNWVPLPSVQPTSETSSPSAGQVATTESASKPSVTYVPLESTTATSAALNASSMATEGAASTPSTPVTSASSPDAEIRPVNMSDFTDVCGRRMYPEGRIVGGEKATFGKWPWQISLRQWRTSTYLHKCGAALLNENWAITAAHCVDNVPPSDLLLRLGEHDLSTESEPYLHQERRVQIVASHPQFDPRTFEYDLALLRFYEPVTFQPNILPVCVPQTDENFVGRTAYVTGWGRLYEDGPLPSILQEVSVPVINNSVCESMYRSAGYIEHIPHIFICAGWRRGGFDSCEGDSGGPMVIQRDDKRFLLAGVISWGIGCAEPNQPGVYTRISEFRDWINQILQF